MILLNTHFLSARARSALIQIQSLLDEVNSKVHETLALAMDYDTAITRKPFGTSEENIRESLKSIRHSLLD